MTFRFDPRNILLLTLFLARLSAAPILIDFGRSDGQTSEGNFNNIYGDGTAIETPSVVLIDSDGADTGITLETDFAFGGSWAGEGADFAGPFPERVSGQPESVLQDSMFIRAPAFTTLVLTGLDRNTTYDILIYGGRGNNGGANTEWTVTDANGESSADLDVFENSTDLAEFTGLTANESNQISILYTTSDDGSRPRGAMSFMQITTTDLAPLEIISLTLDDTPESPTNSITWTSAPNRTYSLLYSSDLENWEEIDDGIPSQGETTEFKHELLPFSPELVGAPRLYYRVVLNG